MIQRAASSFILYPIYKVRVVYKCGGSEREAKTRHEAARGIVVKRRGVPDQLQLGTPEQVSFNRMTKSYNIPAHGFNFKSGC